MKFAPWQKKEAAKLYPTGWSAAELADRYGVAKTTILRHLREEGIEIRPRSLGADDTVAGRARLDRMERMRARGYSWADIGDEFEITRQAAYEYYNRYRGPGC